MNNISLIKEMIADISGDSVDAIGNNASLTRDIGLDSLDIVELSMKLEGRFNISISDEELDSIKTVIDVLELINLKTVK